MFWILALVYYLGISSPFVLSCTRSSQTSLDAADAVKRQTSPKGFMQGNGLTRAAQFHFRPPDYLPLHFGLNFLNPSYIFIRACNIIYMCSLYHFVHKSTTNNANLWEIGSKFSVENTDLKIYSVIRLGLRRTSPSSPPLCAALGLTQLFFNRFLCIPGGSRSTWTIPNVWTWIICLRFQRQAFLYSTVM